MTQPATGAPLWDFVVAGIALALAAGALVFAPAPREPRREDH
ncbi:hypothetical protein ACIQ7D_16175 [Streptomyces sp. NPDC096310]